WAALPAGPDVAPIPRRTDRARQATRSPPWPSEPATPAAAPSSDPLLSPATAARPGTARSSHGGRPRGNPPTRGGCPGASAGRQPTPAPRPPRPTAPRAPGPPAGQCRPRALRPVVRPTHGGRAPGPGRSYHRGSELRPTKPRRAGRGRGPGRAPAASTGEGAG